LKHNKNAKQYKLKKKIIVNKEPTTIRALYNLFIFEKKAEPGGCYWYSYTEEVSDGTFACGFYVVKIIN
jgi:hypothetical protein